MSTGTFSSPSLTSFAPPVFVPRIPTESTVEEHSNSFDINGNQSTLEGVTETRLLEPSRIEDVMAMRRHTSGSGVRRAPAVAHPTSHLPISRVWDINYHAIDMQETLEAVDRIIYRGKPEFAVTANLNYAMLCAKLPRLKAFTERAALVLCDGKPIQWRSRWNKVSLPERVAGSDLIYKLAERSSQKGYRLYFYGAAEGVAERAANRLLQLYPGAVIAGVQCPPFHATSESEIQQQIAKIQQAKPDILLVALGQPKGEFWIEQHLEQLQVPLSIQVGASFDFVTGNAKRAPLVLQKLGLEWFYRMVRDPRRLGPRYFQNAMYLGRTLRNEWIDMLDTKKPRATQTPSTPTP